MRMRYAPMSRRNMSFCGQSWSQMPLSRRVKGSETGASRRLDEVRGMELRCGCGAAVGWCSCCCLPQIFLLRLPVGFLAVARAIGGEAAFGAVLEGYLERALVAGGTGGHGRDGGFCWMLWVVLLLEVE